MSHVHQDEERPRGVFSRVAMIRWRVYSRPTKGPARHCAVCKRVTAGGKPYCSSHVFRMPYVIDMGKP